MRLLLLSLTSVLGLARAAGTDSKRDNYLAASGPSLVRDVPYNTTITMTTTTDSSTSSTFLPLPTDENEKSTTPTCTNLFSNSNFSAALTSWNATGNLTLLPGGEWPSYGVDAVPSSSTNNTSSAPDGPVEDENVQVATTITNAFYANVQAPLRRTVVLAQEFEVDGGDGNEEEEGEGDGDGKLSFSVKVRASRAKPPARMGCEYYFAAGGGGEDSGREEDVVRLVERLVPVLVERGAWETWSTEFYGGRGGGVGRRQGVRCNIEVVEGDFDENEDVTVYVDDVMVVGCA